MKKCIRLALYCAAFLLPVLSRAQTNPPNVIFVALPPVQGPAPLTVQFTNLSTGATSFSWDFGDGNTSTASSPANTYSNAGVYTVSLVGIGPGGTNSYIATNYVTVTNPVPPTLITVTNILLNVNFSLSEFIQNATPIKTNQAIFTANTGKLGTKEIINSLGLSLGKGTNTLHGAKLLLRLSESPNGNSTRFILRQGTNDTDVSQYLDFRFPPSSDLFGQHRSVTTERFNAKAGTTNSIDYGVIQFTFATGIGSFDVQGFVKLANSSLVNKGKVIQSRPAPLSLRAELSGSGFAAGAAAVYRGTFTAAGRKIEIKQQLSSSGP